MASVQMNVPSLTFATSSASMVFHAFASRDGKANEERKAFKGDSNRSDRADAAAPLTCFHSFRHNFRDALRDAKVDRNIALWLGRWTTDGKGTAIADNYGSGYRASTLGEALNAV
jgi:hypothetical protein